MVFVIGYEPSKIAKMLYLTIVGLTYIFITGRAFFNKNETYCKYNYILGIHHPMYDVSETRFTNKNKSFKMGIPKHVIQQKVIFKRFVGTLWFYTQNVNKLFWL